MDTDEQKQQPDKHVGPDESVEALLFDLRRNMTHRGFAQSTQTGYASWVSRFLISIGHTKLEDIAEAEVIAYMTGLKHSGRYKNATLAQAANSIRFLFRAMSEPCPEWVDSATDVERRVPPPTVLSGEQAAKVLARLNGAHRVMAWLAYGAGLGLSEIVTLRVGSIFLRKRLVCFVTNDGTCRVNPLPKLMVPLLRAHIDWVIAQYELDSRAGYGYVGLSNANTSAPVLSSELADQFLFSSTRLRMDKATGHVWREHIGGKGLQRAISQAGRDAAIGVPVNINVLRATFAAEKLASGSDPDHVRGLMGLKTRTATLRYERTAAFNRVEAGD